MSTALSVTPVDGKTTALHEYADFYIRHTDGSRGYRSQVHAAIAALERYVERPLTLGDLSEEFINGYIHAVKDTLSPSTRRNRRNVLVRLWKHAAFNKALPNPPRRPDRELLGNVRVGQIFVEVWTMEQVRVLLWVAGGLSGQYAGRFPKAGYWVSYILTAWDLGLRGCDMRRFPVSAVGPRVKLIQWKTGKPLYGCLRPETIRAIRDFLGGDNRELVWPLWCNMETWRTIARRLVRRAGLPGSIGWLRGSSGTAFENAFPGKGHVHLGNTPQVFYAHYFDRSQADLQPPPPILTEQEN